MRNLITLLTILLLLGCKESPNATQEQPSAYVVELKQDISIRAGMTVDELKKYVSENNKKTKELDEGSIPMPPAYSDPERHLYVFLEHSDDATQTDRRSIIYWVNGRNQFWMS